jgi:hypothetical protein
MKLHATLRSLLGRLLVLVAIVAVMAGAFAVTGSTAHAAQLKCQQACQTLAVSHCDSKRHIRFYTVLCTYEDGHHTTEDIEDGSC